MDIVIEAAVEAAGELLSAGIDAVVDKAVKHKSEYKSEYRRKHTMAIKSLIINPGSTSTKIGVFEDENLLFEETLRHSTEEISKYDTIFEQKDFRKKIITDLLAEKKLRSEELQRDRRTWWSVKAHPQWYLCGNR